MDLYEIDYKSCGVECMQLVAARSVAQAKRNLRRYTIVDKIIAVKNQGNIGLCGYTYSGVLVGEVMPLF